MSLSIFSPPLSFSTFLIIPHVCSLIDKTLRRRILCALGVKRERNKRSISSITSITSHTPTSQWSREAEWQKGKCRWGERERVESSTNLERTKSPYRTQRSFTHNNNVIHFISLSIWKSTRQEVLPWKWRRIDRMLFAAFLSNTIILSRLNVSLLIHSPPLTLFLRTCRKWRETERRERDSFSYNASGWFCSFFLDTSYSSLSVLCDRSDTPIHCI